MGKTEPRWARPSAPRWLGAVAGSLWELPAAQLPRDAASQRTGWRQKPRARAEGALSHRAPSSSGRSCPARRRSARRPERASVPPGTSPQRCPPVLVQDPAAGSSPPPPGAASTPSTGQDHEQCRSPGRTSPTRNQPGARRSVRACTKLELSQLHRKPAPECP